jgi:thiamine biosynthesis lipoprotein
MYYSHYYASSGMLHGSYPLIMGTRLDILLFGKEPAFLQCCWEDILSGLIQTQSVLNRFDTGSEVSMLASRTATEPVGVSEELWLTLNDCKRYCDLTKGYFDITLSGFRQVSLNEENRTVCMGQGVVFDFGGYAKGYALEKIRALLQEREITQAFVNFGDSAVLGLGAHPHGDCWRVNIRNPYSREPVKSIALRNNALSTSGNTPDHPLHLVNPFTGKYSEERQSVSVVCPHAVDAEVLSTALSLMDEKTAKEVCKCFEIENIIIL